MIQRESLGTWDYIVIAFTMLVSVAIGFYFRFTGTRQKTKNEFLMAGKSMGRFPVVFSLVVTKLSAIAIIGEPADIYLYGTQRCIAYSFIFVGALVASYIFLPVYFSVGASTIYEFLELRYGKKTRRLISVLGYIQTLLNMSICIYTPAIAMSAVTRFSTEASFMVIGGVCIVFSTMGGLKAVMWADVFQAFMMYTCLLIILIQGMIEAGGPAKVYQLATEGGRMNFLSLTDDSNNPYTIWNSLSYGVQFGIAYSVNQFEVQRLLAVGKLKDAQSAALWSTIPSFAMGFLTTTAGLTVYAIFKNCNPLSDKSGLGLQKADQIVPYYIVSRLIQYPGLSGLCISGILCASISSLSSALNSLSTIFLEDFVVANFGSDKKLSKLNLNIFAKVLVSVHGLAIIGLAFMASQFTNVLQGVVVLDGMILGPTLAIYSLGVLTTKTNEVGALIGLTCGALFSAWFGLGSSLFGKVYEGLPTSTDGCDSAFLNTTVQVCCSQIQNAAAHNATSLTPWKETVFPLHNVSYVWTYCIGAVMTATIAYISSCIINLYTTPKSVDPKLLCPLVRKCFERQQDSVEFRLEKQQLA